ncbi:S-adenosyl-L-methionine-dependent methyltransferase [Gaertneriomyces semiglobifer]|nr:S-adenosyl-L-methionine-dependent methyltransferase [Gaertneriomyces semiglobifer]
MAHTNEVVPNEATNELLAYVSSLSSTTTDAPQVISSLLKNGADLHFSDPANNGATFLHVCASKGNEEAVKTLLQCGAQWNAVDDSGKSAGEFAKEQGFDNLYEYLVEEGVRTEFILNALSACQDDETDADANGVKASNEDFLARKLTYSEGRLLDSESNAVMMGWEAPLMTLHAHVIAPEEGLDVLNVGFGLGLIDEELQKLKPRTHTIIEAHPDVYAKMIEDGWGDKPGVRILFGRWQDVLHQLETYDGIFFDTFGEYYADLREFHDHVPNILRETGIYSFFNGLAGTNPFFHDVSCRLAEADLLEIGLTTEYDTIQMDKLGDEVWQGTKRAYFSLPEYRLPKCKLVF